MPLDEARFYCHRERTFVIIDWPSPPRYPLKLGVDMGSEASLMPNASSKCLTWLRLSIGGASQSMGKVLIIVACFPCWFNRGEGFMSLWVGSRTAAAAPCLVVQIRNIV